MTVSQIMKKMIDFSDGNIHDIDHFIRVWTYARTIGELENIDDETLFILEAAAITHDIACPLCRKKYGNTNGKYQEIEGVPLVKDFLSDTGLNEDQIERVAFLVGHHHTFTGIDGADWQILVKADYIANATENGYSEQNLSSFMERIMKTESGRRILQSVFSIYPEDSDSYEDIHSYYRNLLLPCVHWTYSLPAKRLAGLHVLPRSIRFPGL